MKFNTNYDMETITKNIKEELQFFKDFAVILDKAENDGYMKIIIEAIREIFKKEINYAVKGKINRIKKAQRMQETF